MWKQRILTLMVILAMALPAVPGATGVAQTDTGRMNPEQPAEAYTLEALTSSPVMFIQNVGQFDDRALFQVWGGDKTIWLAEDSIWVVVLEEGRQRAEEPGSRGDEEQRSVEAGRPDAPLHLRASVSPPAHGVAIKLSFPGANLNPRVEPFGHLETSVNYFIGNDPEKWHTNVPVWAGVRYRDLYSGIDLELAGEGGHVVPRLVARPGADLSAVRLRVEGADEVTVEEGSLRLTTAVGEFTLPLLINESWEGRNSNVQRVNEQTFDVAFPFTIRPSPPPISVQGQSDLLYATFLGGSGYCFTYF